MTDIHRLVMIPAAAMAALLALTPTFAEGAPNALSQTQKAVSQTQKAGKAEMAQAATGVLRLEIMTQCDQGTTVFRVRNSGPRWPKLGTFSVVRINDNKVLSKRRFRLGEGQRASFKVKKSNQDQGELGLFVNPGWYKRDFSYDAMVSCDQ